MGDNDDFYKGAYNRAFYSMFNNDYDSFGFKKNRTVFDK